MAKIPVKGAPWLLIAQASLTARDHWGKLPPSERTELARLIRTARGRPSNLTAHEKSELKPLVGKLDLPGLGRNLVPLATKHGHRRRL